MDQRWIRNTVIAGGWMLLGFVLSLEVYFNMRAEMDGAPVDFWALAIPQFGRTVMWAAMAPFILQLPARLPLRSGRWVGGVAFHLGMSIVVMAVFYLGRMMAYRVLFNTGWGEPFWATAWRSFYGRNIIDVMFYWAVVAYGFTQDTYHRYRSEELKAAQLEARLIETELKALREQLHPHFLFNTLNTVAVLVREQKNDDAVNLIARLSSLLRMTLDSGRTQEVTVRQEMDFLDRYIEIQKARFSDRLSVGISIEPAAMAARIPHLLLQPLVENAILHGIAPKPGPGRIEISGRVDDGKLHLEVSDDGGGLPAMGGRPREGIGLSNTRERIAKIYGAAGQLTLRNEPGRGLRVQIILPCRT
jgi:two-component system, LytTR family, sensor kinase